MAVAAVEVDDGRPAECRGGRGVAGLFARAGARRVLDAGIAVKMLVLALGLIRG